MKQLILKVKYCRRVNIDAWENAFWISQVGHWLPWGFQIIVGVGSPRQQGNKVLLNRRKWRPMNKQQSVVQKMW
jgi:hypothetical protein